MGEVEGYAFWQQAVLDELKGGGMPPTVTQSGVGTRDMPDEDGPSNVRAAPEGYMGRGDTKACWIR